MDGTLQKGSPRFSKELRMSGSRPNRGYLKEKISSEIEVSGVLFVGQASLSRSNESRTNDGAAAVAFIILQLISPIKLIAKPRPGKQNHGSKMMKKSRIDDMIEKSHNMIEKSQSELN